MVARISRKLKKRQGGGGWKASGILEWSVLQEDPLHSRITCAEAAATMILTPSRLHRCRP